MHTQLRKYILQYAKGIGGISMVDVLHGTGRQYSKLAASQDFIGWRSFTEDMISKEMLVIQQEYLDLWGARGTPRTPTSWAKGFIVLQIEITHGQWLYRNVHMYDTVTELHATHKRKSYKRISRIKFSWGGKDWPRMIIT